MSGILFVTWDGGGNVPPATGIAAELMARGHVVRFLGHEGNRGAVESAGLPFRAFTSAIPFSSTGLTTPEVMIEVFNDPGVAADMLAEAESMGADVVVIDCLLLAALGGARKAGLTYVPLEHFFDAYYRQGWLKAPFGQVAEARGHDPFRALEQAPLTIVATSRELDPAGQLPSSPNVLFSGPVVAAPGDRDLARLPATVLVSLSTFNFPGQAGAMQTILDAVDGLPARVIVTAGPVIDPSELRAPDNVEMYKYLDHDEILPEVTLVFGHGGHATTMRALAHDIPLAAMPQHPMLDQSMVGQAVDAAGAGRFVPREASTAEVRQVLEDLIVDGPHRGAAARLGKAIREARGAASAADGIEKLGADR
jgi:UDP:flavonoid glycosyltransferase YjiC (YdhE family)